MSSLRILLHTRANGGGGAERVTARLARALAGRGHRVMLAVDALDGPPPAGPVETVVLPGGHARQTLALARLIGRQGFDVAAGAVSVSNVKLTLAAALSLRRLPLVLSYHGFEEWRTGRLSALAYRHLPTLARRAARIVAVSDGLAAALVADWGAPAGKVIAIANPVDAATAPATTTAELMARPPVVAAVGRLSAEKGFADLIEALALLRTPAARLVIAGDGPQRPALEALAAARGLSGRVAFLGATDGPEPAFGAARVAVCPSHTEAFGLAVAEALSGGLAVVASDCAGPREILDGGRFGRLVPIADPPALAAAIDAALADPGDPAQRRARAAHYSVEAATDRWERVLAEAAGR